MDQSQGTGSTEQSETSTNIQLEISDLKTKVLRLTEQSTQHDGRLTFLARMSDQVDLIENQIIKWRYRLPELTDDDSTERIVSAVEVQEDVDTFKEVVLKKLKEFITNLNALQEEVRLLERDRDESWEAVSHKVSTLVGDSVGALMERLSESEHTVQSRMTTPITEDGITSRSMVNDGASNHVRVGKVVSCEIMRRKSQDCTNCVRSSMKIKNSKRSN